MLVTGMNWHAEWLASPHRMNNVSSSRGSPCNLNLDKDMEKIQMICGKARGNAAPRYLFLPLSNQRRIWFPRQSLTVTEIRIIIIIIYQPHFSAFNLRLPPFSVLLCVFTGCYSVHNNNMLMPTSYAPEKQDVYVWRSGVSIRHWFEFWKGERVSRRTNICPKIN